MLQKLWCDAVTDAIFIKAQDAVYAEAMPFERLGQSAITKTALAQFRAGMVNGHGASGQAKIMREVYHECYTDKMLRCGIWLRIQHLKGGAAFLDLPSKKELLDSFAGDEGFCDLNGNGGSAPSAKWLLSVLRQVCALCVIYSF